jgi:RNA polymerase sigma-70 factor (ECF subfamily)
MIAAQEGDAAAYESLLISLLPVLHGFVRRRGIDGSAVEDIVQEILLAIHRARHTWRPDRPFEPWMWAVARNATTDALRRQGRERARRVDRAEAFDADAAPAPGAAQLDPEQRMAAAQIEPRLVRALEALPVAQREAVELLYVQRLPVAEAAARAGVTATALKVRAHRGTRALRAALGSEDEA